MTKKEMLEEIGELLGDHSISKYGAYHGLLHYIFDCFSTDQIKKLLNHIKKETGGN